MKILEQLLAQSRAAGRRARARLPGPARAYRPARLVARLDDSALPPEVAPSDGGPMDLEGWRSAILGVAHWLGPIRVTFAGGEPAASPLLEDLVRFANRLECPTHVVTAGAGLDRVRSEALIDRGVGAVTVRIADADPGRHEAATGVALDETLAALEHLIAAREDRERAPAILVAADLRGPVSEIARLAREAGADGVALQLALGAAPPSGAAAALAALGDRDQTPRALRAALEGGQARPMPGGPRLEIRQDGAALISPLLPPIGSIRDRPIRELWSGASDALAQARALERPWDEIELTPRLLLSRR